MTNITDTHRWQPPKIKTAAKAELAARWEGLDLSSALESPPFPPTPEGRADLRFLHLHRKDSPRHIHRRNMTFNNVDLTGAFIEWFTTEYWTFRTASSTSRR